MSRGLPSKSFTREQRTMIVSGILWTVMVLVVLQLWLLTATMNAYLGADYPVVWAGAAVSAICLLFNLGLLRHLYRLERK
jgi:Zn-dependent protease